jgi:hypothetical protein
MDDNLEEFTDDYLKVDAGFIYGRNGKWMIILILKPFKLDGDEVSTKFSFGVFHWDVPDPAKLANSTYDFPDADDNDHGSIYLRDAHHPTLVHRVEFGKLDGDTLGVRIDCEILFDIEGGGFQNRVAALQIRLKIGEPRGVCGYELV